MQLYRQTDEAGIYMYTQEHDCKPDRAVSAALPEGIDAADLPPGKLLRWETDLCHNVDMLTWGDDDTGQWLLEDDRRSDVLFLTADGSEYKIGDEVDQDAYAGHGPLPAWLTDQPRPSVLHQWVDGAWYADSATVAAAEAAAVLADAQARIASETARATVVIDTIAPAVAGGYAEEGDDVVLAAWQQYRYKLSKVPTQADYPTSIVWPEAPDATPQA